MLLRLTIFYLLAFLLRSSVFAETTVSALFSDHMVLQHSKPIKIWGTDTPGQEVTIRIDFGNKTETKVKTNAKGSWLATCPAVPAEKALKISVIGSSTQQVKNAVAGEVWVCSGQSNMEWPLRAAAKADAEIKAATYPLIRHFLVEKQIEPQPSRSVRGKWEICSPEVAGHFSAVAYFYARRLHKDTKMPIGIINSSWGGTVVEAWTSAETLRKLEASKHTMKHIDEIRKSLPDLQRNYTRELAGWWNQLQDALNAPSPGWNAKSFDHSSWKTIPAPGHFETHSELHNFDGKVWFRRHVQLPADWRGSQLELSLGKIDDADVTFVNGQKVGETANWEAKRLYKIPKQLAKDERLTIAVEVLDTGGVGGFHGNPEAMQLRCKGKKPIPLAGDWHWNMTDAMREVPPKPDTPPFTSNPNTPTALHNGMIAPLIPFTIKGVIWYQGESNVSAAHAYRSLFPGMVRDWRQKWGQGDFPFLYVQLANFLAPQKTPGESAWAELREAQTLALSLKNTGMACAIDIGEAEDIHPKNKQEVGKRLAIVALANVYGKKLVSRGPEYASMKRRGKRIEIRFKHAENGLVSKGPLKHFAIAGSDRKFRWAKAEIEKDRVSVSHPQIPEPVAVRYAWANNPASANLRNKANLPAVPFRTDNWAGITTPKKPRIPKTMKAEVGK